MDLRIKYLNHKTGLCLFFSLFLLSQEASAQFKHKWQAKVAIGTAIPATQNEYYWHQGYPHLSLIGNMKPGFSAEAQVMRNLNDWLATGGGVAFTSFSGLNNILNEAERKEFSLGTSTLNLSGKLYPLKRNHRFTPFLQADVSYGQVRVAHGKQTYAIISPSENTGNPDNPYLREVVYYKPEASQKSNVLGYSGTAGIEMLLGNTAGVVLEAGYHLHKTEEMQVIQENLVYWDVKAGLFFRLFKTKLPY